MEKTIKVNDKAARAIAGIAHSAGTAELYLKTLARLFNSVLYNQDDLGMDDTEAITTLQVLGLLRSDIEDIAATDLHQIPEYSTISEDGRELSEDEETLQSLLDRAYNKAAALVALIYDIADIMKDEGHDAEEVERLRSAAELATSISKITKQALDREDTRAADDQEAAEK